MPVAGEPLVRRILRWLAASGVARAVLNLHHRPETICAVVGDGSDLGLHVRYSWEQPILGSAGGPRRALPLVAADRFLIVNGDTLTDLDLGRLANEHEGSGALVTLAVIPNRRPDRYGGVLVDDAGTVTGFIGRGSARPSWHYIGVQAVESRAFERLRDGEPAETIGSLYPALIRERPGSVRALTCDASFVDIGTPADYLATSLALAGDGGRLAGERCVVPGSASVVRSVLWDDVSVGDGASLVECVVADGVRIPAGARWTRRAIIRAEGRVAADGEEVVGDLLAAAIERTLGAPARGGPQPS
jgi:NDP-sugar pyrophosphorylase family protein